MRARELAATGARIGRYSIEAKLRFKMRDPLATEILADQRFDAELDAICAEAAVLRANRQAAARAAADAARRPMETRTPERRRLNADQKRALKAGALQVFVRQYARKAQKRTEPNDRRYDLDIQAALKRTNPMVLDRLLRDDEED